MTWSNFKNMKLRSIIIPQSIKYFDGYIKDEVNSNDLTSYTSLEGNPQPKKNKFKKIKNKIVT